MRSWHRAAVSFVAGLVCLCGIAARVQGQDSECPAPVRSNEYGEPSPLPDMPVPVVAPAGMYTSIVPACIDSGAVIQLPAVMDLPSPALTGVANPDVVLTGSVVVNQAGVNASAEPGAGNGAGISASLSPSPNASPVPNASPTPSGSSPSNGPSPVVLTGHIEHHHRLPAVDQSMRPGTKVNVDYLLRQQSPNNRWFKIPAWSEGRWAIGEQRNYFSFNYVTNSADIRIAHARFRSEPDEFGSMQDRNGDYWHYAGKSYWTKAISDDAGIIELSHVQDHDCIAHSAGSITIKFISTRAHINIYTRRVTEVVQVESIQTYTPGADGLLRLHGSLKTFDHDGMPLTLSKGIRYERRLGHLPLTGKQRHNAWSLFREFCLQHGMPEIVPPEPPRVVAAAAHGDRVIARRAP